MASILSKAFDKVTMVTYRTPATGTKDLQLPEKDYEELVKTQKEKLAKLLKKHPKHVMTCVFLPKRKSEL